MAGKRSQRTPLVRTAEERALDGVGNAVIATVFGQGQSIADGKFEFGEHFKFEMKLPFGKASFSMGNLIPLGSSNVYVPSEVDVNFSQDSSAPIRTMKIEVRDGIPSCTEIHLTGRKGGRGLRPSDLTDIDVAGWIDDILSECQCEATSDGLIIRPGAIEGRRAIERARTVRRTVTPELLQRVAEVYRQHVDAKPIESVSDEFGVPYRTAARYVQLCRSDEFGLLPKTHRGKRKV
jgi:hypothetical protein